MMTRRAVEQLKRFPERNLFLRAVVPLVGFKSDSVYYSRTPRTAGTTKYPLKKMLAFAWNGVSSFSIVPLRLVTLLGFLISLLGAAFIIRILFTWNARGTVAGWSSTITLITCFSGVQLLSLGVIGEYIAKIFVEVKRRPLYIVDEKSNICRAKRKKPENNRRPFSGSLSPHTRLSAVLCPVAKSLTRKVVTGAAECFSNNSP